jgi:uncharacterized membrane protein (DUF373 family)
MNDQQQHLHGAPARAEVPSRSSSSPAEHYQGAATGAAAAGVGTLRETREAWPALSFYERFEQVVCLVLTFLIACLIAVATWHLVARVAELLLLDAADPANQAVFQAVFGMVMTVLIALEFKHSMLGVLERKHGVIQVRSVVLLALVRKFIIIDATKTDLCGRPTVVK